MSTALLGIVVTLTATLCAGPNVWTRIGPEGGFVESLAVDPQNSATLYAGMSWGLAKSIDSGATWKPLNYAHLAPTSASIDPKNPSTMYAGLRFGNASNGGPWLFKSTDGAASWTISNSGLEGFQFSGSLTVDPQNPSTSEGLNSITVESDRRSPLSPGIFRRWASPLRAKVCSRSAKEGNEGSV